MPLSFDWGFFMTDSEKSVASIGGIPVIDTGVLLPLCEEASQRFFVDLGKRGSSNIFGDHQ